MLDSSLLWLCGVPGSGKTVLTLAIIKDIQDQSNNKVDDTVAYLLFDYNDQKKQGPNLMSQSLICQLLPQYVPKLRALIAFIKVVRTNDSLRGTNCSL
jgi:ABC-type dipeptide/oligopeptide/nickel transport system ATPase component